MIAVIMAGGRGTRIASVNSEVPKPMIPLAGKPVLEYQLEALRRQGIKEFVFVIGYLGEVIRDYFGNGAKFAVHIDYIVEESPLGTAGALYFLRDKIKDDFLLLCGDLLFDVDIGRFYAAHRAFGGIATLLTHPNSHPYDSSVIVADSCGKIVGWLNKEDERLWYKNRVNAGLHMFSPRIFDNIPAPVKTDLDRDVLKPLIGSGQLFAYDSPEYVKDMGTPDRYYSILCDLKKGRVTDKNLRRRQRAIFLDRDGTINRYVGFLRHIEDFELIGGAAEAIRRINESNYLAIVATNQPVIARGEVTEEALEEIHCKMETLLGREGAYLDAVYVCPHHPDRGFAGERPEYKINCSCRKPKPGLLYRAADKFNIDLSQSWMIGDSEQDILCGRNAGCKTAFIGEDPRADICGKDLLDCVLQILQR